MTHRTLHIVKHNRIHELWNIIGSCAFSPKMNNYCRVNIVNFEHNIYVQN